MYLLCLRCVFAAFSLIILNLVPAIAAGLQIGPICLDNVKIQNQPNDTTFTNDGRWDGVIFKSSIGSSKSKLVVLDQPIDPSIGSRTCDEVRKLAESSGRKVLLSGTPLAVNIRGFVFTSNSGSNRIRIDPGSMFITIGHVDSGDLPLAGGTVHLSGSRLWLTNTTEILDTASSAVGTVEIEAWDRKIENVKMTVGGASISDISFLPRNSQDTNSKFRLDISTGNVRFWQGDYVTKSFSANNLPHLDFETIQADRVTLAARDLHLLARNGAISLASDDVSGEADAAHSTGLVTLSSNNPHFTVEQIQSEVVDELTDFKVSNFIFKNLSFNTVKAWLGDATGSKLLEGQAAGKVSDLEFKKMNAQISFLNPISDLLSAVVDENGAQSVQLSLTEADSILDVAGKATLKNIRLANFLFDTPQSVVLPSTRINISNASAELRFPFDISIPKASGTITVGDNAHKTILSGTVGSFNLAGDIVIPLQELENTRMEIPAEALKADVFSISFLQPALAGTEPTFGNASMTVHNPGRVTLGRSSSGELWGSVSTLVLAQPAMQLGQNGSAKHITASLTTKGNAEVAFDLATTKLFLARAEFEIDQFDAKFVEKGAVVDLNGILITDPAIHMEKFYVGVFRDSGISTGKATLNALNVSATELMRPEDPSKQNEISFSAKLAMPFTVSSIEASSAHISDSIQIDALTITNLSVALSDANVNFGKSIKLHNGTFSLSIASLISRPSALQPIVEWHNAQIHGAGSLDINQNNNPDASLDISVSGDEDKLTGSGQASISGFTGHAISDAGLGFECDDHSNLSIPIEYNYAIAGAMANISAVSGRFTLYASVGPLGLFVHSIRGAQCKAEHRKWVVVPAQHGWTWGFCSKGFEVYRCQWEWSTAEVNFWYHIKLEVLYLQAGLAFESSGIYLEDGHASLCNQTMVLPEGIIVAGGYVPEIETNFPGADEIINTLISVALVPVQSVAATGIANSLITGASIVATGTSAGSVTCMLKL